MDLKSLRHLYARTLLEDVVPFWLRHAIDADGGINTCIADDGRVVSRERWCWSQWRAVWTFSKLYNAIEQKPQWLETARGISDFMQSCGRLADGHWPLLVQPDGAVLRGYESIFTDSFAIYGLVELWHATHDDSLLKLAVATYQAVEQALAGDLLPPVFPYPAASAPDVRLHGISMIFSLVYYELAMATGDAAIRERGLYHHDRVMNKYLCRPRNIVWEWLDRDDHPLPPPTGTALLPGHAIESMWFQMHIAQDMGTKSVLDDCVQVIRRNLELGWDTEYGGLYYAIDADGRPDIAWFYPDTKLWWTHSEALYATLLAHEHCQESWCLEWHEKLRAYCYAHYPVPEHGEWRQKLDRQGRPIANVVALPVKDPFHLPRALILSINVLDRLLAE